MKLSNCLLTGLLMLAFSVSTAHAQLGTPRYKFRGRNELKGLLLKNRRNARALYDLTILANRRGFLGTVLNTGDEMLKQNRRDPYAQALVSFGVNTGLYARFWNWPVDKTAGNLWNRQGDAAQFQSQSLMFDDSAIQLMAAVSKANAPNAREFEDALDLFRAVLKKQPKWADAHYWYAGAVERTAIAKGTNAYEKAVAQALPHYYKAVELDEGMRYFVLSRKATALSVVGRPREALAAFNGYLRAYPAYEKYWEDERPGWVAKERARLTEQIARQGN